MSCNHECPICMDDIQTTNCTTTECGHQFHTSCLMKNIAHNGFGCPYCRSVLAEVPDDDVSDDLTYDEEEEEELYDDYALRGMRWMFQQNQNEPLDEEEDEEVEEPVEPVLPKPSAALVAAKLVEQGVTMEDLVKSLLSINHEEYEDCEDYELKENEIFGKLRIIISNYNPEQEREIQVASRTTNEGVQQVLQPDSSAQPKTNRRNTMYFMREHAI